MSIEVWHGGKFEGKGKSKKYVGGSMHLIKDYDTDTMGYLELRYMLKEINLFKDYLIWFKVPGKAVKYKHIKTDSDVMSIFEHIDINHNGVLYIEHLNAGEGEVELLPSYCLQDTQNAEASNDVMRTLPSSSLAGTQAAGPTVDVMNTLPSSGLEGTKTAGVHEELMETLADIQNEIKQMTNDELYAKLNDSRSYLMKTLEVEATSDEEKDELLQQLMDDFEKGKREVELEAAKAEVVSASKGKKVLDEEEDVHDDDYMGDEDNDAEAAKAKAVRARKGKKVLEDVKECEFDDEYIPEEDHDAIDWDNMEVCATTYELRPRNKMSEDEFLDHMNTGGGLDDKHRDHTSCPEAHFDEGGQSHDHEKVAGEKVIGGADCDPPAYVEPKCIDSDSLHSLSGSDSDDVDSGGKAKWCSYKKGSGQDKNPVLERGMVFESPQLFREHVRNYACRERYELRFTKNEGKRIRVRCKVATCPFSVFASYNQDETKFQIKSLVKEHDCYRVETCKEMRSTWLAKRYSDCFRDEPNMKGKTFMNMVWRDYNLRIKIGLAYKVKKMALDDIYGVHEEHFRRLRDYAAILLERNPGSHIIVKTTPVEGSSDEGFFFGFFVSFAPMIKGMLAACRPIIGVDGCFLKTTAGGVLLTAVSRDPNNQMYPIAWAIVKNENKETWSWFLQTLVEAIGVDNLRGWTFISDRQKGLIESFKEIAPEAKNRFCVRHIYANFAQMFKGMLLRNLLWEASKAYTIQHHTQVMNRIKDLNEEAYEWLTEISPESWCRAYFQEGDKCTLVTNNICECFNKVILDAREKPLISMMEYIRRQMMSRFQMMRLTTQKWKGLICPFIKEKLELTRENTKDCSTTWAGGPHFEVLVGKHTFVVDIDRRYCDCRKWQLTGVPCVHACSCLSLIRLDIEKYTDKAYYIENFKKAYEGIIFPIPDSTMWPKLQLSKVIAYKLAKKTGRRKKQRRKAVGEPTNTARIPKVGVQMTCKNCKQRGHNARGCKNPKANTPPRIPSGKKGGRPRTLVVPRDQEEGGSSSRGRGRGSGGRRRGKGRSGMEGSETHEVMPQSQDTPMTQPDLTQQSEVSQAVPEVPHVIDLTQITSSQPPPESRTNKHPRLPVRKVKSRYMTHGAPSTAAPKEAAASVLPQQTTKKGTPCDAAPKEDVASALPKQTAKRQKVQHNKG